MKKIFILFMLAATLGVSAEKVAVLQEVSKPDMLHMNSGYLYITEGATVFVYSRKDFSLVNRFGKAGEGPREFKITPFGIPLMLFSRGNDLFVSSDAKVSRYSETGEFIREFRVPPFMVFRPFKDQYLATGNKTTPDSKMVLTVNLYDKDFKKIRELYQSDVEVGPNASFSFPMNSFSFEPWENRIFIVAGREGFVIDVFDESGKKLRRIKKDCEKVRVSGEYRGKTLDWFKSSPAFKQFWEFFKTRINFKSYFPEIMDIALADNRIYVLTNRRRKKDTELVILDLQGRELKRKYVPLPMMYGLDYMPKYKIFEKKMYFLREDLDEEVWELHAVSLQ